ncbi:MAG: FAD-dependent oxidoreductase [Anaerolineales bacterium]|nr:FAD-dependent oxidoreductase [Anaerolineales bacterium]
MPEPHVVILGAGPAGLGAAYRLAHSNKARVTLLERHSRVGGNAGSFELAGIHVDYGSHRLHPATDPAIMAEIRQLLGDDLTDQPRHGRIRLRGRWIHFPLKPADLALRLPPSFAAGVAADSARKLLPKPAASAAAENFATVLEAGLGRTICRDFYFPYAVKLWGQPPETLSAIQARRRVAAGSLGKMVRKVLSAVPGLKPPGSGRFFYPRRGFGQISEAYHAAACAAGADVRLGATVTGVRLTNGGPHQVQFEQHGQTAVLDADYVWSTIPLTILARGMQPAPPPELLAAASNIDYRAMILIYLVLHQPQFTEYDAHYFPETDIPISRLSEPKNYSKVGEPADRTVLCAELPCAPDDAVWQMSDEALGQLMRDALARAGIPVRAPVLQVATRRLRQAYPIYQQGYEVHFEKLDDWLSRVDGLLSFGRQGLFAHDNTHHALYMAHAAVDCLQPDGRFDHQLWQQYREIFKSHVVED